VKMQSRAGKVANQSVGQSESTPHRLGRFHQKIAALFQFKSWENL